MDNNNGYRINNPDGILNLDFDQWKKSCANNGYGQIKETSSSDQQEIVPSEEICDTGKNSSNKQSAGAASAGQGGANTDGNHSNVASSSGAGSGQSSLAVNSVISSGIGTLTSTIASTLAAAIMVVAVFVSTLTISLSLVMADVDKLVVQISMEGAQDEDFETPIVAILEGEGGVHIEQSVFSDTRYLTFEGLAPEKEYSICVRNEEKIFDKKSFSTASVHKENGSIVAYAEGKDVVIIAKDVVLGSNEIYSIVAKDASGNKIFGEDSDEKNKTFKFTPDKPTDLYITLSIGGEVYAICELKMNAGPLYDFEHGTWKWTDDYKASISFADFYGGDPLVISATVTPQTTVLPGCETVGEKTYTATATYDGVNYKDVKTVAVAALGHEYGEPSFTWTETSDGYTATAEFICARDGHKETVTAEVASVTTRPTCEKDGFVTCTATVVFNNQSYSDEKIFVKENTALGHEYGEPSFTWTETENGYVATAEFTCIRDGYKKTVEAEVLAVTARPTCEDDEYVTYTATVVFENESYSEEKIVVSEGTALGHEYGELIAEVPATYDETGMAAHYHCSVCGKYFDTDKNEVPESSLVIGALGHTYGELIAEIPATCEEAGTIAHYHCAVCGKFFNANYAEISEDDLVIPPAGHTYGELIAEISATCEEPGTIAHYHCAACGKYFDSSKNEISENDLVIAPLGHSYGDPSFVWTATADGYTATAEFTCARDSDHKKTVTAEVVAVTTPPTCEKDGYVTYTATVVFESASYSDEKIVVKENTALGHEYGDPLFKWTETADGYTATAEFTCIRDGHKETVTAEVVAAMTSPTCEKDGYVTYTAMLDFESASYSDEKIVVSEGTALGHEYGEPVFTWTATAEGYTATAEFTCARDSDHKKTVTAEVVAVTTPPACEKDGYVTYTATVVFEDESYSEDKIVVDEETALGHSYGDPSFVWTATADGYTAIAEFTCIRDGHKETVTAEVVAAMTSPTCEDDGYITYTATVIFENESYSGEKIVVNEDTALGHEYGEPSFTWTQTENGYTATAVFTCTRNGNHKETVTAEVVAVTTQPTCEEDGYITYTATVIFENESYSEDKIVVNEDTALGHEYGDPSFTWTQTENGYTATAEFTCTRNGNHKKTVTAEVTAVTTQPTCEEDGYITYTAAVVFENERYTDEKVVVNEKSALGHDFSQYYEGSNARPTFVWTKNDDGSYSAVAVFCCNNDNSHTMEVDAEIGVEDGVDCTEGGNIYYYADVVFNDCNYTDEKIVEVAPGHNLIPVFHWITNADGYTVEFYMVCTREDYQDGPIAVELATTEEDDYTLYTATAVYGEKEYTESKKVLKTEKPAEVGETYMVGDTMIIDGNVYFSDDYERAKRTSMTGNTPIVDVGYLEGTTQTDSFDAIIIENDQFVRVDDNGWAAGETPEWLFTPSDKSIVGVKIESGSGELENPYILKPIYGVKVIFEANDGIFNTTEDYSVTQYYTEQEIEDGVYAIPPAENPESSGKLFLGWFVDEYAMEKFDFEKTPITESITLYAGWIGI